jgi:uncharacterized protein (DUF2267 family)
MMELRAATRHTRLVRVIVLVVSLFASVAYAQGRVSFLAERLHFPPAPGQVDDFRVRTNAALALGATNDDAAVEPLCAGLADPSEVVRQAVAVALRRLARTTSLDCMKSRIAIETSGQVKEQLQRAIHAVEVASPAAGPASASARFYVSLSRVTNHTLRSADDIDHVVRDAVVSKLSESGAYELAPASESADAAKAVLTKRGLKGYYLSISVDKFDYSGGALRVRVKIAVFSYPGKDLRGEIPSGGSLPGVRPGDTSAEDQLVAAVAARAAELFTENFM